MEFKEQLKAILKEAEKKANTRHTDMSKEGGQKLIEFIYSTQDLVSLLEKTQSYEGPAGMDGVPNGPVDAILKKQKEKK